MNREDYIKHLSGRRSGIQQLWRSHADKVSDWSTYFLRYRFEILRGLIIISVAILGISGLSTPEITTEVHKFGSVLLIGFIVFAVILDHWRSESVLWSQQEDGKFVNDKLAEVQILINVEQMRAMRSEIITEEEIQNFEDGIRKSLVAAFEKRQKSLWEKASDRGQGILEGILISTFLVAVIIYFY